MVQVRHHYDVELEYDDVEDLLSDGWIEDVQIQDGRHVSIVVNNGTLAEAIANSRFG